MLERHEFVQHCHFIVVPLKDVLRDMMQKQKQFDLKNPGLHALNVATIELGDLSNDFRVHILCLVISTKLTDPKCVPKPSDSCRGCPRS